MRNQKTLIYNTSNVVVTLIIGLFLASCTSDSPKDFVVEGEIKNTISNYVKLEALGADSYTTIDTAKIQNGKFKISKDLTEGLYRLRTKDMSGALYVYARNGDKLNLQVEVNDINNYNISGNAESVELRELTSITVGQRRQRKIWRQEIDNYTGESKDSIQAMIDGSIVEQDGRIMAFIDKVEDPEMAAFAIQLLTDLQGKMDYVDETLAELQAKDPDSEYISGFARKMDNYKKIYQAAAIKAATREGGVAPEIALPNPEDEIMKLTDLRGKVVLLDFWASWCRPCRVENPRVVAAYNKYKNDGFEVFSVSLDRSKDKWIRAIEHDGLVWDGHVSDLKHWRSEAAKTYKVGSIPATFLLDRDGKVIAKNLRGAALDRKLEEIFGS